MASFMRCDVCLKEIGHEEHHMWQVGELTGTSIFYFDLCDRCFQEIKASFQAFIEGVKKRRETGEHDGSAVYRSDTSWHY